MLLGALGSLPDLEEVRPVGGTARNGEEVLKLVKEHKADVCRVDI